MPATIHSTAIVSAEATFGDGVVIGPYAIIEGPVTLGANCRVGPHCQFLGRTTVGVNCVFHHGCVIGDTPQHGGYKGEDTATIIGENNTFREHSTVHRGMPETGSTVVGHRNLFMAGSHVGHDCRVGDGCTLANGSMLGGHAELGDGAFISGSAAVHQFCRVGRLAMIGGLSATSQDCPPFWMLRYINIAFGVNIIGMRRAGFSSDDISAVRRAYKTLNNGGQLISHAVAEIEERDGDRPPIRELVDFIRCSKRGIVMGRKHGAPNE